MSLPATRTAPLSANSKPAAMRSAVVLPQPDGPSSETSSPWWTSRSNWCKATLSPKVLRIDEYVRLLMSPSADGRAGCVGEHVLDDQVALGAGCLGTRQQREDAEQERGARQRQQRESDAALRIATEVLEAERGECVLGERDGDRELAQHDCRCEEGGGDQRC